MKKGEKEYRIRRGRTFGIESECPMSKCKCAGGVLKASKPTARGPFSFEGGTLPIG